MNSSRIVTLTQKIYQLLMINISFFLATLPLMIAFVILSPKVSAIPFYLIASLTLGPALFATVACLKQIMIEKEIPVFSTFFYFWRKEVKLSMFLTGILTIIITIGFVDMKFFSQFDFLQWLNPIILLLLGLAVMIYGNALVLYTKREKSIRFLLKDSAYHVFKQVFISLVNGLLLIMLVLTMIIKPVFGFLVFPSILVSILLWNSKKIMSVI